MSNRRDFLRTLVTTGAAMLLTPELTRSGLARVAVPESSPTAEDPWSQLPSILARIKAPVFPKREFDITRFGAVPDGRADSSDAFRKAIEACNKAGGGRVIVPAGEFSTGAIHLKSNVNLYL